MAIVKYTHKDGTQYAYSSLAYWDPVRKQNRPIRKYLGRVDPATGEIIPSSGKRGRPLKSKTNPSKRPADAVLSAEAPQNAPPESSTQSVISQNAETAALMEQNAILQAENEALRNRVLYLERNLRSSRTRQPAQASDILSAKRKGRMNHDGTS